MPPPSQDRAYLQFYPEPYRTILLSYVCSRPVVETAFYLFLRSDGVHVPGTTHGPNSWAVQIPVRVAEPFYWRVHYLTKHLAAIFYFANERLRVQPGNSRVGYAVRTDLHPSP